MFEMRGLRAENPQGWMAAIGVLYILDREGWDARMVWEGAHPVILGATEESVIDTLALYLARGSDILDHLPQGIGKEKAAFDFTAGRVSFTGVIAKMLKMVDRDKIVEALTQPWRNRDDITSLGWDTGSVKLSASAGGTKAPDTAPHRGVCAGQWLAAESLPITGTGPRRKSYTWVTWSVPLDLGGVRAVVLSSSTAWGGVCYSADIAKNGELRYLRPARTLRSHQTPGGLAHQEKQAHTARSE